MEGALGAPMPLAPMWQSQRLRQVSAARLPPSSVVPIRCHRLRRDEPERPCEGGQPGLRTPLVRQKQHAGFINLNLARILKKEFWACLQVTRRFHLHVMLKIRTSYLKIRNSLPESACHCRRTALQSPPGARLRRWQNVAHPTATARSRGSFRLRRWCRFNATDFGETSRSVRA